MNAKTGLTHRNLARSGKTEARRTVINLSCLSFKVRPGTNEETPEMAALFSGFAGLGMTFPVTAPTVPAPAADDRLDEVEQASLHDPMTEPDSRSKSARTSLSQPNPNPN